MRRFPDRNGIRKKGQEKENNMQHGNYLAVLWQQTELWQLAAALICGVIVGVIYFESLHWSVVHLTRSKHKIKMFASVALFRIILFFSVLALISQRNAILILFYVTAFFLTKIAVIAVEKNRETTTDHKEKADD